jgi:hypothetical protein
MGIWLHTILFLVCLPHLRADFVVANPSNFQSGSLAEMRFLSPDSPDYMSAISGEDTNPQGMPWIEEKAAQSELHPDSSETLELGRPRLQEDNNRPAFSGTVEGQRLSGDQIPDPSQIPSVVDMPTPMLGRPYPQIAVTGTIHSISPVPGDSSALVAAGDGRSLTPPGSGSLLTSHTELVGTPTQLEITDDTSAAENVQEAGVTSGPSIADDGGMAPLMDPSMKDITAAECTDTPPGVYPDPTDVRCWSICLGLGELGARFCCAGNECFQPWKFFPHGKCQKCAALPGQKASPPK